MPGLVTARGAQGGVIRVAAAAPAGPGRRAAAVRRRLRGSIGRVARAVREEHGPRDFRRAAPAGVAGVWAEAAVAGLGDARPLDRGPPPSLSEDGSLPPDRARAAWPEYPPALRYAVSIRIEGPLEARRIVEIAPRPAATCGA